MHINDELSQSAFNGNLKEISRCLRLGADINYKDSDGSTPLMIASQNGHLDIVKLLLENGADTTGMTIAHWARVGWLEKVQEGMQNEVSIQLKNSALVQAVSGGHFEIAKYLVENGADVNTKNATKCTTLIIATAGGDFDTVKYLVELGVDVHAKNQYGNTALRLATKYTYSEIVEYLKENGATE